MGPALPRAGPIPAIHVATELADVTGSIPVKTIIMVPLTKYGRDPIRANAIHDKVTAR